MGAVASITIIVDDKGAVRALNNVTGATEKMSPAFQKAGSMGNLLTTSLVRNHEKARESVQLLANTIGVQLPRSLEKVIAAAPGLSGAMNIAFSGAVVAAFALQIIRLVNNFDSVQLAIEKAGLEFAIFGDRLRTWLGLQSAGAAMEQTIINQQKLLLPLLDKGLQLRNQAALSGLQGFAALAEAAKQERADIELTAQKQSAAALEQFGHTKNFAYAEILINSAKNEAIVASEKHTAAERIALARQIHDQTRQLQNQAKLSALTGIDQIREKERQDVEENRILLARKGADGEVFDAQKLAAEQITDNQIIKMQHDAAAQGQQAILQAEAAGLAGQAQLDAQRLAELQSVSMKEQQQHIELTEERLAIDLQYKNKSVELARQRAGELQQLEAETAIAMLPPWQRADAQIVADAEKRVRDIQYLMAQDKNFEATGAREIALVWQQAFAQMRDSLAQNLESLFDDITSGNIGKRFLDQFKHLVFQMIASWMLGLNQMRSASQGAFGGGGGGILGAIFGSLLGINFGGGGGGVPGVSDPGFGIPIPGIAGLGGGGGSSASSGGGGLLGSLFGGLFGGSSSSSSSSAALASLPTALTSSQSGALNLLGGSSLSAGGGAAGAILPAGASAAVGGGKGFSGMLSRIGGLGGVFGLLAMGGMSLLGTNNRALQGLGGFLTGGAIGSLVAMSSIGASLGALGAFLGPIGAVVGLLAGLFLHGSTRKARLKIEADIKAQAQKIEDSYNAHQLDYDPAVSQLEQLRQQGVDALRQAGVKDISRSRVGHVDHWIDKAETEMKATEADRARRLAVAFGPAQFRVGGFVSPNLAQGYPALFGASAMHFAGGGAVPAILHAGEFVMRPEAVRQIGRGNLEAMNAGGGGGGVHIHLHALDGRTTAMWLRTGGDVEIAKALERTRNEGRAA